MGYVESNLLQGERVVVRGRVAGAAYLAEIVLLVIGLLLSVVLIGIPIVIVAIFRLISLSTIEIAITDRRVIGKRGLIGRTTIEMFLSKVESFAANQDIFGRLFGYGTIVVNGTGSGRVGFPCIASPQEFKKAMAAAVDASRKPDALIEPRLVPPSSIASEQLLALFDVQVVDPKSGAERWVEVRAVDMDSARDRAVKSGAMVGEVRLKSIG